MKKSDPKFIRPSPISKRVVVVHENTASLLRKAQTQAYLQTQSQLQSREATQRSPSKRVSRKILVLKNTISVSPPPANVTTVASTSNKVIDRLPTKQIVSNKTTYLDQVKQQQSTVALSSRIDRSTSIKRNDTEVTSLKKNLSLKSLAISRSNRQHMPSLKPSAYTLTVPVAQTTKSVSDATTAACTTKNSMLMEDANLTPLAENNKLKSASKKTSVAPASGHQFQSVSNQVLAQVATVQKIAAKKSDEASALLVSVTQQHQQP